jgi:hypothetical protein
LSTPPKLFSSVDWGAYERIRLDDQVKSCMEQRIRAVVGREWDVLPGDDTDPRSVAAGDALKKALQRAGWDRVTEKMLWASFYGYQVAELNWGADAAGLLGWVAGDRCRAIHVRHARRFRLDTEDRLRLLTRTAPRGELLPPRKFWMVAAGGTDDDTPYGQGLAEWLYWPTLFKRNGVRFWNVFLDKFSVPTAMGKYPRGTTKEDIGKLLGAIVSIANDSGFAIPNGMDVELLTLAQTGADFGAACRYFDGGIAKVILSQTMTTDDGSSKAQGEVHADVKDEVVDADADLLCDSFNAGPARWYTDFNFGPDVASPIVIRPAEEPNDTRDAVETDKIHHDLGWRRSDESHKDRYGDGYERIEPAKTKPDATADEPPAEETRSRADNVVPLKIALAEALAPIVNARDIVDEAVEAAMADDPLVERLLAADTPQAAADILAAEATRPDLSPLVESLARAGFALRIDALTDAGADA